LSKIYFVGAGPGDPDLITVKGKRLLEAADLVVYAGSLVNPKLLEGLKADLWTATTAPWRRPRLPW
jgi:precorrin-4/cobalt-precorrin-4 C11-methyltransferase